MKTSKLIVEYDYDFEVLAVRTSSKGYKLAWLFNKELKLQLSKADDIRFDFLNDSFFYISNYLHETEYSSFRLIRNRAQEFNNINSPFLLPELKDYDYLIQLTGETPLFNIDELINAIKAMPSIEYVQHVDVQQLKSKENLIF